MVKKREKVSISRLRIAPNNYSIYLVQYYILY